MKVGIFVDLRNPPGWRRPWDRFYEQSIDSVVQAEQLGADSVWLTEHHLFEDGYLPQPLVFAAALAARTSRIRIGTAVLLALLRHPLHIAEEAALVDLISGGRVELGLGPGYVISESEAFGVDISRRFDDTDRAALDIRRLLDGGFVRPQPLQRPFPLWLGYQGPRNARRAGRLGAGLLTLDRRCLVPYFEGLEEGGYSRESGRMAGVVNLIVSDDPEAAWMTLAPYYAHQLDTYAAAHALGRGSSPEPVEIGRLRRRGPAGGGSGLSVMTPDDAVSHIRELTAGLPAEHVYFWSSIAGMPDGLANRHRELVFTRVAPALRQATDGTR
jgi:alkanesulfonate monooxygenase SsuD/methylene tetrahydromethanopterin reductase-like flavin-dependent oxidoreductase (luciferase family)